MPYIKITFPDGRYVRLVEQSRIYEDLMEEGLEGLGRMDHGSFMNISYKGKLTPGVETRPDSLKNDGFEVEYNQ
jgi:hypothetical protein